MVYISFLISHVPPAHSFFKKTSILENTAESLPAYFLTLTKILIFVKNYRSDEDCVSGCRDDGNIVVGSD